MKQHVFNKIQVAIDSMRNSGTIEILYILYLSLVIARSMCFRCTLLGFLIPRAPRHMVLAI